MDQAPEAPTITLPRLDNESAQAYAARVAYVTLGPNRTLDQTRVQLMKYSPGYTRVLAGWSDKFEWKVYARAYDDQVAALAIQKAASEYIVNLEEHRQRYQDCGKALYMVASKMLNKLNEQAKYMEYSPNTLNTIARALTIAADMEAHALRIADLLPRLTPNDSYHSE